MHESKSLRNCKKMPYYHNPRVGGSSPSSATSNSLMRNPLLLAGFLLYAIFNKRCTKMHEKAQYLQQFATVIKTLPEN